LSVTKALRRAPVHVTLVDRSNHFLFQPLLYQVAMAGLAPAEIAAPIRSLLRNQDNVQVLLAEVADIDFQSRCVHTRECPPIEYDYLVLAPGASTHYFGHAQWAQLAPGLKDLDDAVEVRRRVLLAFEAAEREADPLIRRRHLTFVVIGGGPTGVELAGAIAELATYVLSRDFRSIRPDATRVLLLEGGDLLVGDLSLSQDFHQIRGQHDVLDVNAARLDAWTAALVPASASSSAHRWRSGLPSAVGCLYRIGEKPPPNGSALPW